MKALVYRQKNTLNNSQIKLEEMPEPALNENNVLCTIGKIVIEREENH